MNKIESLIGKIKQIHDVYVTVNNEQKSRLFDASLPIIAKMNPPFENAFVESVLMFGKEFLISEGADPKGLWSPFFL